MNTDMDVILERVRVTDILDDIGWAHTKNRAACPVHDGNNRSAFSFTDFGFTCFHCGASGGLIDLLVALHRCTRVEAYRRLRRMAGLSTEPLPADYRPHRHSDKKYRPPFHLAIRPDDNPEWVDLKVKVDAIENQRRTLLSTLIDARLGSAKTRHKQNEITVPLERWYAIEQTLQYQLGELDEQYIFWSCRLHRTERRIKVINANADDNRPQHS